MKVGDIVSIRFGMFDGLTSPPCKYVWCKAKILDLNLTNYNMTVKFINGEAPDGIDGEFYKVDMYQNNTWRFEKSM